MYDIILQYKTASVKFDVAKRETQVVHILKIRREIVRARFQNPFDS